MQRLEDLLLGTEPSVGTTDNSLPLMPEIPDYILNDSEIVGYPDVVMQHQIYDWVIQKISEGSSVKDFGAGRGDFGAYMNSFDKFTTSTSYTGIEKNTLLCRAGGFIQPQVNLINDDFFNVSIPTDYTVCIGTLNDDHGFDKWEYFNKTLNHAKSCTTKAIIFVLASNMAGISGFLDYPIDEMIRRLFMEDPNCRFKIDYSTFEDIYCLTVHIGGWNV